jgi:hypothetical protein
LLTGQRPFDAPRAQLFDLVIRKEPKPPRQIDDALPRELERICQKALAKRLNDRYQTAKDLADDLKGWLALAETPAALTPGTQTPAVAGGGQTPAQIPPDNQQAAPAAARVIPKGLRSFDAADAEFYLELLPGPRDRQGLPPTLRFWKQRIEAALPEETFTVGVIYGPSGCGKSSLVKAGLLPRLNSAVTAVYIEATAQETEARLLAGLRQALPAMPPGLALDQVLAGLRRGKPRAPGPVLLVLDQFEQWLHARPLDAQNELVRALRHCDGAALKCIVLVRDDF